MSFFDVKAQPPAGHEEKRSFVEKLARFITKNALSLLIFFVLATLALVPLASKLKLRANFLDLLPATHPSIKNLNELTSHVGGTSFMIAVIESTDEKTSIDATKRFGEAAASFKQVEFVDNRTEIPAFANRKLLFLNLKSVEKLQKNVQNLMGYYRRTSNPFYVDLLEEEAPKVDEGLELEQGIYKVGGFSAKNRDSFMQVLLIKPKHPISDFVKSHELFDDSKRAFEEIKNEFKHPVTLGITGPYRSRYEEYHTITSDLKQTGIVATILLILINLIAFRNIRSMIYAYLPLALGTVWIWAFTEISIGYLNIITAFLAAILFGMGGDYTFHILVSFEEDYRLTGDPKKAMEMTFAELWNPLWSSMWTTAVVFYAMIISDFSGFRHFGIIAGIGIVISFIIVLVVQPCLIVLGETYFPIKRRPAGKNFEPSKPLIYSIIAAGVLFTIFSVTKVPQARFNYNFMDLQAKNDDSTELSEKVGSHFGIQLTPVVFMTPSRAAANDLAVSITDYIHKNSKTTVFDFAAAITSHVPQNQEEKIKILGEIDQSMAKYQPMIQKLDPETKSKIQDLQAQLHPTVFDLEELPAGIKDQYEGKGKTMSAVFVYPSVRILDGEMAKKFVKEARNFPVPAGVKLAGEAIIYADILNIIERDTPIAVGISTLVVFLLVLLHFRRLDHALWVHMPLALGILWMIGMMGLAHLKLNFFNMVIMPSILGVGIDNGIYIFDRYRERKNENFFESIKKSLKGVMLSSATNLAAFGSIMFASHQGMASMGKLGFFGFLGCLLSSVLFVPALIELYELKYAHLFKRGEEK